MTGGWIESYPEDVKKIAAAGHDLGNHSEITNRCLSSLPMNVYAEIQKPHDKVKELTGTEMTLFRPPYGDYNNTLIESANALGYHVSNGLSIVWTGKTTALTASWTPY